MAVLYHSLCRMRVWDMLFRRFFSLFVYLGLVWSLSQTYAQIPKQYDKPSQDTIKILAIGNSFSEDALENYLFEMARSVGQPMVIGNLYIGGASLALHWKNLEEDLSIYAFRKTDADGNKTDRPRTSIRTALDEEDWDYISVQQVSQHAGQWATFNPYLEQIVAKVRAVQKDTAVSILFHQIWAYDHDATHDGFALYDRNQKTMFDAILQTSLKIRALPSIDHIIPAGAAIQYVREQRMDDRLTRDGYHLSIPFGRFVAACTWFHALVDRGITPPFRPEGLTEAQVELSHRAARKAVQESLAQKRLSTSAIQAN
jgi:hypothetical protein